MLAGIVVNNGIVLVDYTNLLRVRGYRLMEACVEAGRQRLRPILITTITTICGMIPLAFFPGEGARITQPVGITIVGGLACSVLITLFFVPVLYSLIAAGIRIRRVDPEAEHAAHSEKDNINAF
jgi:HAE1 family hydrophobic/amphiphilic exporter-1